MTSYKTKRDWIIADLKLNETTGVSTDGCEAFCTRFNLKIITFTRTIAKMYKDNLLDRFPHSIKEGGRSYVYKLKEAN